MRRWLAAWHPQEPLTCSRASTQGPCPFLYTRRCNSLNEVWVPSEWSRRSFIESGVLAEKIRVVPEGINTTWFDPSRYEPLNLYSIGELVLGSPRSTYGKHVRRRGRVLRTQLQPPTASIGGRVSARRDGQKLQPFVFLSSFKWEMRKGYDILLEVGSWL